jgi:histidine triad (HIT) family protein
MSLDGAYDAENVFAKILRGEMPAAKVFENDHVLAFMDVFPQSRGHTLVISKMSKARNLLDVEPEVLSQVVRDVQRVAVALRKALDPDGVVLTQFSGAAAGQTVFHLHFHLIPRWTDAPLKPHGQGGMADIGELNALAARIAAEIIG